MKLVLVLEGRRDFGARSFIRDGEVVGLVSK